MSQSKLLKSAATVGFMTLLSRILGQLRETLFAILFGATAGMDAFLVAFKIPNFMRRLFAEGSFSQAFVPILSEYKSTSTEAEMKSLIQHVAGTLGLIVLCISLCGMIFSGAWVLAFAPGFWHSPEKYRLASELLRITFPYIFFISLTALAGGVLNCFGRFSVAAFTPVLLNVAMIGTALCLAPYFKDPIEAGAWGVVLGGLLQLLFQLPFLARMGLLTWPKWGWQHPGVQRVIKLMLPALFGASIAQIGLLMDTVFASFLKTGSVSWLNYADRLMQFPLGIFGIALSTVILPHLASHHSKNQHQEFNHSFDWALKMVLLVGLPASLGMMCLSGPIVISLFQYRNFTAFDAKMTQEALMAFSAGLLFFIWVKVLVSAYYARQDTRTPVRIGIIAMCVNIACNVISTRYFGHVGLAMSTTIASAFNCGMLFWILRRRNLYQPAGGWRKISLAGLFANAMMALVLWYSQGQFDHWVAATFFWRALHLTLLIVLAMVSYLASLWLAGIRPRDFLYSASSVT